MPTVQVDISKLPEVFYVSMDPLSSTVGASQVLAYVERLAQRGVRVRLLTFEHRIDVSLRQRLTENDVDWRPLTFGRHGLVGGLWRVIRAALAVRGARLAHARSDLAALAVLLGGVKDWVWDARALYVDQKISIGVIPKDSTRDRVLRRVEGWAARQSSAIVTLTEAVIPELDRRYDGLVLPKATVITTCADTRRFVHTPLPVDGPLRVLMLGTLNPFYDIETMLSLFERLREQRPAELIVASPEETAWEAEFASVGVTRISLPPAAVPELIASCHLGLSVCRDDAGVSLLAAMPTKIGEFLSCGRPIVVNRGLVDVAGLIESHRVGAVVASSDDRSVGEAVWKLVDLIDDPEVGGRARELALEWFDLDSGVDRLIGVYHTATTGP